MKPVQPLPNPENRRKKFLVDRELQLRLVARLGTILAANLVLFVVLAIVMPAAVGYFGGAPQWGVFEALARRDGLATTVVLPLACAFLCLFGQGIRETQKIAGPDFRLRTVFRDLSALRIPRGVRIRKNDYLQSTAAELNTSLERLHDEVATLRKLARYGAAAVPEEAHRTLGELVKRLDQFTLMTCAPECRLEEDRAEPSQLAKPAKAEKLETPAGTP